MMLCIGLEVICRIWNEFVVIILDVGVMGLVLDWVFGL